MADTVIVGRVAIRVLPDTDGFKERLRRDLEKETAGVDATVPVEGEFQGEEMEEELRRKVKELSDRFAIKIKSQMDSLRSRISGLTKEAEAQSKADPIDLTTRISVNAARAAGAKIAEGIADSLRKQRRIFSVDRSGLAELNQAWGEFSKDLVVRPRLDPAVFRMWQLQFRAHAFQVNVHPDLDSGARQLMQRKLREIGPGLIDVTIDEHPLRTAMLRLREALKRLFGDIKVAVKGDVDEASLAAARRDLITWYQRFKIFAIEVRTVLNKKSVRAVSTGLTALSGGRLFKKLVSLEPFKNLDTDLPKIALMATLLGQASNYIISMAGDALSLGRSIGYIAPAALALPGIFMAAATSLYAVIAPMKEFNDRIPEMGKGLKILQESMIDSFWSNAHKGMDRLVTLLPALTSGFKRVGGAAGAFMGALSSSVVKNLDTELGPFFASISAGFRTLSGSADGMGRILGIFTRLGTTYMPRLAAATTKVVNQFATWLDSSLKSGDLLAWVDRGISNLKALGGVVAGVYRVFDGLSQAAEAAGAATLTSLAGGLHQIQKIIKTPEFQSGLTNVFRSSRIAIEQMVRVAGPAVAGLFKSIGQSAQNLLPLIGQVAGRLTSSVATILNQPVIGNALVYFFQSLDSALDKLQPSLKNASKGMAGIIRVLGTMATSFEPIIEIAFGALENHAEGLLKTVEVLIRNLSSGLTSFIHSVMPAIDKLAPAVLKIADAVGSTLGSALTTLGGPIAYLVGGLANLLTAFSSLPGIVQTAAIAFVLLNSKMGATLALKLAPMVVGLKKTGTALGTFATQSGIAGSRVVTFASKAKTAMGKAAGSIGKFAAVALTVGAIGSSFLSAGDQFAAGSKKFELALARAKSGNLDDLNEQIGQITGKLQVLNGQTLDGITPALRQFKDLSGSIGGNFDLAVDSILGFVGITAKSGFGQLTDTLNQWDQALADMSQNDSEGASRIFDQIVQKALKAGWTIDELKAKFPEYQSAVSLAAGRAAGDFTKSADEIKTQAAELRSAVEGAFTKMDERINALRGKARNQAIKEITTTRANMLKGLAETTTGLDAKMVEQATRLNTKIAGVVKKLGETKDAGTRKKLKTELDGLLAEYKERFSNLPGLIEDAAGAFDPSKLLGGNIAIGGSVGITGGAQLAGKIKAAFDGAKVAARTGAAGLKATIAAALTSVSGASVGSSLGTSLTTSIKTAFQSAKGAATIAALGLGASIRVAVATAGASAATTGSAMGVRIGASTSKGLGGGLKDLKGKLNGFVSGFKSTAGKPPAIAKSMASKVRSAVSGISLVTAGANVGNSYVRGLRSTIGAAIAAARAIGKATKDNKGPESYDKVMLTENGVWVVQGFVKGLRSQIPLVEKTMQDITSRVAGTEFGTSFNRAAMSASQISTLSTLSLGTTQVVNQIGDVTIDVSNLEGIKTVDELAKTLRRKKRQAGG